MKIKDYYSILNISFSASTEEISAQYRFLARQYHPDINKTKEAEVKFKEINEAYENLKTEEKRQRYNMIFKRHEIKIKNKPTKYDRNEYNSFLHKAKKLFNFSSQFNNLKKQGVIETSITVTKDEILEGVQKKLTFEFIRSDSRNEDVVETKTFKVAIPRNIKEGSVIRLAGQGAPLPSGGNGDLLLKVSIGE